MTDESASTSAIMQATTIAALLAPIIDRIDPDRINTHGPSCYQWHAECLAIKVKWLLTDHDAEVAAKAWDEGHDAGWNSRDDDAARGWVPSGVHESDAVNPYRKAVQS